MSNGPPKEQMKEGFDNYFDPTQVGTRQCVVKATCFNTVDLIEFGINLHSARKLQSMVKNVLLPVI